jgi:hypothetical protein
MALITDATMGLIRDQIGLQNEKLRNFAALYASSTWAQIQLDVKTLTRAALIAKYPIGTELVCKYTMDNVEYDCPWVVLDNDRDCTWQDGSVHQGLWLGMKYCTIEDMQFDAPEGVVITADDETVAEAGYYYCGVSGSTYTMLNLAAGDTIPFGDYDSIRKGIINHKDVYQYGYNRYRDSAQRQWLNSAEGKGNWWEETHYGDAAPSQLATRAGFMAGLDADFLAVITPVKVQVSTNTVTDGGDTDVMYDKFFLQSLEEVYGIPQAAGIEGAYFPYWKEITGLDAPTNGSGSNTNPARQIRRINSPSGSAAYVRLRSAYRGTSGFAWYVASAGYLNTGGSAYNSFASQPACVIS